MPAFSPNPASASRNTTFTATGLIEPAANGTRSKLPVSPYSNPNRANRHSVAKWLAARYSQPAARASGLRSSVATRKNAAIAIPSQPNRKVTELCAKTSTARLAASKP